MKVILEIRLDRCRSQKVLKGGIVLKIINFPGIIRTILIGYISKIVIVRISIGGLIQICPLSILCTEIDTVFGVQFYEFIYPVIRIKALYHIHFVIQAAGVFL